MSVMPAELRETNHEKGGFLKGVGIGKVTQNKDPEGLCRVKVHFTWHGEPGESHWARLVMPMAGKGRGLVTIPEVGDEVLVACDREHPDFVYVLGSLWNGKDKPPLANDDGRNDKRTFKSRKGHFLLFDDGRKGVVELAHENGGRIVFDDTGFSVRDKPGNEITVDSTSGAMTIKAKGHLTITAAAITITAGTEPVQTPPPGALEIQAKSILTVKGTLVRIN